MQYKLRFSGVLIIEEIAKMVKKNKVERLTYSGGLLGVLFGSSKGKLQSKVEEMNENGWNLHMIYRDEVNLVIILLSRFLKTLYPDNLVFSPELLLF